jgi:hypothetical protein
VRFPSENALIVEAFNDFDLKPDKYVVPFSPYIVACMPQTNQATMLYPRRLPARSPGHPFCYTGLFLVVRKQDTAVDPGDLFDRGSEATFTT